MSFQIFHGDSATVLKTLPSNSIDSLLTDPPAGIGFLNFPWDDNRGGRDQWIEWMTEIMKECFRVLKPGAHGFVWALPRTSHWTASALELAGFQVKDVVTHIFGSGFPKSVALDKVIARAKYTDTALLFKVTAWIRERRNSLGLTNKDLDQIAGVTGGANHWTAMPPKGQPHIPTFERWQKLELILGPPPEWMKPLIQPSHNTEPSKQNHSEHTLKWKGWGTALKPASEHWILVQKPHSEHNIAANILKHGTGGLNIDKSRIPVQGKIPSTTNLNFGGSSHIWDTSKRSEDSVYHQHPKGRFPANLIVTRTNEPNCPAKIICDQGDRNIDVSKYFKNFRPERPFHYCKKPGTTEKGIDNIHPTVKPLRLMRYLCAMITPPDGTVLDPFLGSGTTGVAAMFEKFHFVGIEQDESYFRIAEKRIKGVKNE